MIHGKCLPSLAVLLALHPLLRSQDEPERKPVVLPVPRYQIEQDGKLSIALGKDGAFVPAEGLEGGDISAIGFFGYLSVFLGGRSDLISLTDAVNFFERREGGEEVGILRTLARKPQEGDGPHHNLLRIIAARAAQRSGLKPAIGLLERALGEKDLDPSLREACEDALASLRGGAAPARERQVEPLESALASVPKGADLLVVHNAASMPALGGELMSIARRMAEAQSQRIATIMGDDESSKEWIEEGVRRSALVGNLGYVVACQIGNARIDRMVAALKFREDFETQPYFFFRVEGAWNLPRLAELLRESGAPVKGDDESISITSPDGHTLQLTSHTMLVSHEDFREAGGAEQAKELLVHVRNDASISMWWSESAPYPDELGIYRISEAWITVPQSTKEHVRIHTSWATPAAANAVAGWTAGLGRLLGGFADRQEELVPVAEAAAAIKTTKEGKSVDFDVPLPEGDLGELAQKVISGLDR